MIPTDLQGSLKARVEQLFSGKLFKNPKGELVPLQVFEQHLPEKKSNEDERFPCVLVQLNFGEQKSPSDQHTAPILFVIGIYYDEPDNQGHKVVMEIINKLFEDFSKHPFQNMKYEVKFPLRWGLHEEDVAPYYWGAVETTWVLPTFQRTDVEALI